MPSHGIAFPDAWRLRLLLSVMLASLAGVSAFLFRVQVVHGVVYAGRHERQSMRRVRLPGSRGRIFDRHGICLAENRPSYCVAIYVEELRRPGPWRRTIDNVDREIDRLAEVLRLPRQRSLEDVGDHVRRSLPMPLLAWTDVDAVAMARLLERSDLFPAVDIYVRPERRYPGGAHAAHVIGYVGRDRPRDEDGEIVHFYEPDMRGRAGIENQYDAELAGRPGGRLMRVDARGYKHDILGERAPVPGRDLYLTLDSRIQRFAETAIAGQRAAMVVLDPRNGDVLALASAPAYDVNRMTPAPDLATWRSLNADPGKPLFNRAISGTYPSGSTFKPLVAMAGMMSPGIDAGTVFDCTGTFDVAGVSMRCWRRSGHGPLAMRASIEQSCNPYYYQLALSIGYERILRLGQAVGVGIRTGIDLGGESAGLMPDEAWKRRRLGENWWAGDTCNVAIGQGALLCTPLQMAVLTAALANGGTIYRPRLRYHPGAAGEVVNRLAWDDALLAPVRNGMYDVVHSPRGTGRRAYVDGLDMAGKTGTAQYGTPANRRYYAWMIAYAPFSDPRYAVALVIEDSDSGGLSAAPAVQRVMSDLVRMDSGREDGS